MARISQVILAKYPEDGNHLAVCHRQLHLILGTPPIRILQAIQAMARIPRILVTTHILAIARIPRILAMDSISGL